LFLRPRLRVELALFSRRRRVGGLTIATQASTARMHLLEDLCRCERQR